MHPGHCCGLPAWATTRSSRVNSFFAASIGMAFRLSSQGLENGMRPRFTR